MRTHVANATVSKSVHRLGANKKDFREENPSCFGRSDKYTPGELTDVTITLTVNVKKQVYAVNVGIGDGDGYIEYEGNKEQHVFVYAEEDSRVLLKAGVYDTAHRVFLRWEIYNYDEDVWELYSGDSSITIVANSDVKLRAIFGGIVKWLRIRPNTNISNLGVEDYHFEESGVWEEALGKYVCNGYINIYDDSEYVNDIVGLFENFNIVAVETNGRNVVIEASELVIDLGEYKAEYGWYEITVSYGSFTMTVNVMVVPAYN